MTPTNLRRWAGPLAALLAVLAFPALAAAQEPRHGGEANLVLPDLGKDKLFFNGGIDGKTLLYSGLVVSAVVRRLGVAAHGATTGDTTGMNWWRSTAIATKSSAR